MTQKIPKQLFVVSKLEQQYEYDDDTGENVLVATVKFGFLHPRSPKPTEASIKRENTQLGWAYEGKAYLTFEGQCRHEGQWRQKGTYRHWVDVVDRYSGGPSYRLEEWDRPIDPEVAPVIWDNDPLTGFKIINTVSRYRGNKLYRVSDPRGVEFEITALCLFNLLTNGTIQNGEIIGQCVWAGNKNLVFYTPMKES